MNDMDVRKIGEDLAPVQTKQEAIASNGHLTPVIVELSDVVPEEIRYFAKPWVPLGKLSIFGGMPGRGKSMTATSAMAAGSVGGRFAGVVGVPVGISLICSAEDGLADTIRPRLDSMGADVSKVASVVAVVDGDGKETDLMLNEAGLAALEQAIVEKHPQLVIIDPLMAFIGGGVDVHRQNEVRDILRPLARLAEQYGCAIIAIIHFNKSQGAQVLNRLIGSVDFGAAPRSVCMFEQDPEDEDACVMVHVKASNTARAAPQGYKIDKLTGEFGWTGERDLTTDEIFNPVHSDARPTDKTDAAVRFLEGHAFPDGNDRPAGDVISDAAGLGIAERTLRRAFTDMGGEKTSLRGGHRGIQGWLWSPLVKSSTAEKGQQEPLKPILLAAKRKGGETGVNTPNVLEAKQESLTTLLAANLAGKESGVNTPEDEANLLAATRNSPKVDVDTKSTNGHTSTYVNGNIFSCRECRLQWQEVPVDGCCPECGTPLISSPSEEQS
jgi:AAA domain